MTMTIIVMMSRRLSSLIHFFIPWPSICYFPMYCCYSSLYSPNKFVWVAVEDLPTFRSHIYGTFCCIVTLLLFIPLFIYICIYLICAPLSVRYRSTYSTPCCPLRLFCCSLTSHTFIIYVTLCWPLIVHHTLTPIILHLLTLIYIYLLCYSGGGGGTLGG